MDGGVVVAGVAGLDLSGPSWGRAGAFWVTDPGGTEGNGWWDSARDGRFGLGDEMEDGGVGWMLSRCCV